MATEGDKVGAFPKSVICISYCCLLQDVANSSMMLITVNKFVSMLLNFSCYLLFIRTVTNEFVVRYLIYD
ncbi:hypothetical protein SAMN05444001_1231 [Parabacteroides chinchillae]|uniref:Uncharacterized protein n=1 Tax=Parabacteroides chinchillae TaxID=871327 RepID=A0A8G2F3W7_9BACT|nr:hypothetical protein SAMN05444001_1231 [Parabacteroides chinchillae]